ncbi:MAG: FAD-binding oxidoreductase [Sulfitobacter sp.]
MTEIIVIGGGIAGLSAAARLSGEAKVTVLEQETATGYHASGRSAALFEENYGLPGTVALNRASKAYHLDANGGYLSPRGFLIVADAEQAETFRTDVKTLGLDPITPEQALKFVPILDADQLAFVGYHADALDIDTDRMMQDYAREIRHNGGQILTRCGVRTITKNATNWAVTAGDKVIEADMLVNAAGAWVDIIAEMAGIAPIGITPRRRSMARIPAPAGHDVSTWPMFFGAGETWYAKPDAGALLVSPADADPVEPHDAWADDMVLAEGIARYEKMVTVPVTRVQTTWAGLRSFAPDGELVLGPDPEEPTFVWAAGQGGYGIQSAPAASQLVADLALGRRPEIPEDIIPYLTPDRLKT